MKNLPLKFKVALHSTDTGGLGAVISVAYHKLRVEAHLALPRIRLDLIP
jgi:hypothetical protein